MSTEETKPVVAAEPSAVEPTPAPAGVVSEEKPAEPVEAKVDEAPKPAEAAAAPAEEKKEEKKEEKPVEPIYSGALGYKAPGLKNAFRFSKRYFWFGEEPIPASSLGQYLRGEKAEVGHGTAAWSSVTGKGLLYFVKHADQKETPAGVLNLSDASELTKDGYLAFHFKLHGGKHTFEGQTTAERNGWFVAFEKAIEEAKAAKEEIIKSETYKEQLEKLGKPALAAAAVKDSTPKKSTDVTPKPAEGEAGPAEVGTAAARAGSASSSSADEAAKKKSKSKSRSVSRGKRASIFGGILGKKDEKKEEKKEEKAEETKEETPAVPAGEPSVAATAPVITTEIPKVEEAKPEEAVVEAPKEEKKAEEKPKPTKRGSIFGTFVEKLKSPTHEKKETDVGPAPPAKEAETAEAPKVEETPAAPAAPVTDGPAEPAEASKTEETKPTASTPAKEKSHFSFGKFLGGAKEKVKSPTSEKAPDAPKSDEAPKLEETPAPAEPVAAEPLKEEPPKEDVKKEEPVGETSTTPHTKKRGSIFGNLGGGGSVKKEGDTEKPSGLKGLFRNASKAGRSKKEKEPTAAPAKVEESAEPKEETEAAPVEKKEATPAAPAPVEQAAIGDVVPDAVTVGQAPKSTPEVATTA